MVICTRDTLNPTPQINTTTCLIVLGFWILNGAILGCIGSCCKCIRGRLTAKRDGKTFSTANPDYGTRGVTSTSTPTRQNQHSQQVQPNSSGQKSTAATAPPLLIIKFKNSLHRYMRFSPNTNI